MNTYQIHVDTGSISSVTQGSTSQANVSKVGGNPFQCTIILGNRHRAIRSISLKNAQIPIGFYNIRAPYNTMNINSVTTTISPGNYSITSLLSVINSSIGISVGTFSQSGSTNKILFSGGGATNMNVQPQSLLSFLGFTNGQTGTNIVATNSYIVNFDSYISIWIENLGTSSLEPVQVTFKLPNNVSSGGILQWAELAQNKQVVKVSDRGVRLDRLNIQVLDRFGNLLNNNGIDWSFTLEIESDT